MALLALAKSGQRFDSIENRYQYRVFSTNQDLTTDEAPWLQGTVDLETLTYPTAFGTYTVSISVDGVAKTLTFSSPADSAAVVSQLNAAILAGYSSQKVTASLEVIGATKFLILTGASDVNRIMISDGTMAVSVFGHVTGLRCIRLSKDVIMDIANNQNTEITVMVKPFKPLDLSSTSTSTTADPYPDVSSTGRARGYEAINLQPGESLRGMIKAFKATGSTASKLIKVFF